MTEEGYIKFKPEWIKQQLQIDRDTLSELNKVRSQLIKRNWLGILPNEIGFGNLSVRLNKNEFLITGSATGKFNVLNVEHLSVVKKVNIQQNSLLCHGETVASAESMSHAACYNAQKDIKAIIHIHDHELWHKHLLKAPTSSVNAEYGTPEMALAISELIKKTEGVLVMGGHEDGIIAYGRTLDQAMKQLHLL